MATPAQGTETKLQIRRTFSAPRPKVFEAWTEREKLEKWMCRDNPKNAPRYIEFDVRPGGSNRMEIRTGDPLQEKLSPCSVAVRIIPVVQYCARSCVL